MTIGPDGRRHLSDEWPYDPLPNPAHLDNGREICNAEYVVAGVIVGHCQRTQRKDKPHRGKHRISWTSEEAPDEL